MPTGHAPRDDDAALFAAAYFSQRHQRFLAKSVALYRATLFITLASAKALYVSALKYRSTSILSFIILLVPGEKV